MGDPMNFHHTPKTSRTVVPPSTISPQSLNTQPPPSQAERFVQALGHDYHVPVSLSGHFPRDLGSRPPSTHGPYPMPPHPMMPGSMSGVRIPNFGVPAGMMELRSPMGHQPSNFMTTHPNFPIPFPTLSPTMVPLESPSPTPLSPGFLYNAVPPRFSPQFHQASPSISHRKHPEAKEKTGVGWLDAAQRVLESSDGPLHIDEIRKRVLDLDILRSNTRSSLEASLKKDLQRGSKRFRKVEDHVYRLVVKPRGILKQDLQQATKRFRNVEDHVYRLVTPEELTAQVKHQITMISNSARASAAAQEKKAASIKKLKYKKNYYYMRRVAKQMVFENGALADALAQSEQKLARAKTERRFLLNRLLNYMAMTKDMSLLEEKRSSNPEQRQRQEKDVKKRKERTKHRHKRSKKVKVEPGGENVTAPRRRIPVSMTKHNMLPIPLHPSGEPIFPIELPYHRVYSLGEVNFELPKYHDKGHIYPVGFVGQRHFADHRDPSKPLWYTCRILDGGAAPLFEILGEGDEDTLRFTGESINACHMRLLEAINRSSSRRLVDSNHGVGAEFFGISNPTICNLIQNLPNAERCQNYKMKRFETCQEQDEKRLRSWCAEDPRVNFDALQRSSQDAGSQKRPDSADSKISMTDSDRLRVLLNRSSGSQLISGAPSPSVSSVDDLSTQDGDIEFMDHIDVT